MRQLVFVYNADSGKVNALIDAGHKLLSPSTYKCNLCKLAFGLKEFKKPWKDFLDELHIPFTFLHKDEFEQQYDVPTVSLPAVFSYDGTALTQVVSSEEINGVKKLDELIKLVKGKITTV